MTNLAKILAQTAAHREAQTVNPKAHPKTDRVSKTAIKNRKKRQNNKNPNRMYRSNKKKSLRKTI